jgi:hypothetical protein
MIGASLAPMARGSGEIMQLPRPTYGSKILALTLVVLTPACGDVVRVGIGALAATAAVAITVEHVYRAQEAELDVEMKKLQLQYLRRDGERATSSVSLTPKQVEEITKARKVQVKQADGSTAELAVAIK